MTSIGNFNGHIAVSLSGDTTQRQGLMSGYANGNINRKQKQRFERQAITQDQLNEKDKKRHGGNGVKERLRQKLSDKKSDYTAEECVIEVCNAYKDHFGHEMISPENEGVIPKKGDKQHLFFIDLEQKQQEIIYPHANLETQTKPLPLEVRKAFTKLAFIQNILAKWEQFENLV